MKYSFIVTFTNDELFGDVRTDTERLVTEKLQESKQIDLGTWIGPFDVRFRSIEDDGQAITCWISTELTGPRGEERFPALPAASPTEDE
jgi:hypothetical protein